jgi:hypothetical protein
MPDQAFLSRAAEKTKHAAFFPTAARSGLIVVANASTRNASRETHVLLMTAQGQLDPILW